LLLLLFCFIFSINVIQYPHFRSLITIRHLSILFGFISSKFELQNYFNLIERDRIHILRIIEHLFYFLKRKIDEIRIFIE
jgi:hypothetical protein